MALCLAFTLQYYSRAARRLILGQRISKTPAVPLEKVFPHISTAALQMVSRMMQMDPMARPSTTEILLDPYFKHIRSAPYHKKSLAERLEPDPRIPTLLHLKGLGEVTHYNMPTLCLHPHALRGGGL